MRSNNNIQSTLKIGVENTTQRFNVSSSSTMAGDAKAIA